MRAIIEATKAYKKLDTMQKLIYGKRASMLEIERQYRVAKSMGSEKWQKEFNPNRVHKAIVLELLNNDKL